jgi:hypothetical protein
LKVRAIIWRLKLFDPCVVVDVITGYLMACALDFLVDIAA